MEYIIIFVLLAVLVRTLRSKDISISTFRKPLVAAVILTIFGELSFTLYSDVYGFQFPGTCFQISLVHGDFEGNDSERFGESCSSSIV